MWTNYKERIDYFGLEAVRGNGGLTNGKEERAKKHFQEDYNI